MAQDFPDTRSQKIDSYAALRLPEFRNYIFGRFLLTVASLIQAVIVGWQVYELTKDPFSLGLIGLAEAVPSRAYGKLDFTEGYIKPY